MSDLRRVRKKHLYPLSSMTVGQIVLHIEGLKLNQLRALVRAMDSCTTTNCGWTDYEVVNKYRNDVGKLVTLRESQRKKKVN